MRVLSQEWFANKGYACREKIFREEWSRGSNVFGGDDVGIRYRARVATLTVGVAPLIKEEHTNYTSEI